MNTEPTTDRVKRLEFKETGFTYIRIQRWAEAEMMLVAYYNPEVKRIVNEIGSYDQYAKILEKIANKLERTVHRIA